MKEPDVSCPHCQSPPPPVVDEQTPPVVDAQTPPVVDEQPPPVVDEQTPPRRPSAWREGLGLALAAAALVALGALVPRMVSSEPKAARTVTSPSQVSGTLICLECELARRNPRPGLEATLRKAGSGAGSVGPAGSAPHGRLHLRADDGMVWSVLTRPSGGADPLEDHALVGHRAAVFGILDPDLHAIDAARLELP